MPYFWLTFPPGHQPGCVTAVDATQAQMTGTLERGVAPVTWDQIPLPSDPRLGPVDNMPALCKMPTACRGKAYCPRPKGCDGGDQHRARYSHRRAPRRR